jgi:hypothetical protein
LSDVQTIKKLEANVQKKKFKMGYCWKNKKCVPQLNLCGIWLNEMGFEIGDGVNVHVLNQQIIIHKIKKTDR